MSWYKWLVPDLAWAFPRDRHHQLIQAAIGCDLEIGQQAAHDWLTHNDIDDASFRDHRLLLAVATRFGQELQQHSAWPRLVGLQRMLWTRSRMASQESKSTLARLTDSGIDLLLIKGAARLAVQNAASKQRVAWDVDMVVRPEQMQRAFDVLVELDWTPSMGQSCQYIRQRLSSIRSINLFKGNFGDIDLHRQAFHDGQGGEMDDRQLWSEAHQTTLEGFPVRVPQAEDCIAIAIAHGGLDGHTHSDWMIDCAAILRSQIIDWQKLLVIFRRRQISTPAAVLFRYFREQLGFVIPESFMSALLSEATLNPTRLVSSLVQARPREQFGPVGQAVRAIVKKHRKHNTIRVSGASSPDRVLRARTMPRASRGTQNPGGPYATCCSLTIPAETGRDDNLEIELLLDVQPALVPRRIELEINSRDAHLCRIRYRKWLRSNHPLRLRVFGTIPTPGAGSELQIVSRPSRQLRSFASDSEKQRYERLPFRVVSCRFE